MDEQGKGVWEEGEKGERLRLTVDGSIRDYPKQSQYQLIRGGIHLVGYERAGWGDPGVVVGYNHYDIDRKNAADAGNLDFFGSHIAKAHVDIALVGVEWLRYIEEPDKTGIFGTAGWSHWFLVDASNVHKRVEVGLAVDGEKARTTPNNFYGVLPSAGAVWRFGGTDSRLGTYDTSLNANYEYRRYGSSGGQSEHQGIFNAQASADAWLCPNATVGLYVIWTHRSSNFSFDQYTRGQYGARLTASW